MILFCKATDAPFVYKRKLILPKHEYICSSQLHVEIEIPALRTLINIPRIVAASCPEPRHGFVHSSLMSLTARFVYVIIALHGGVSDSTT
jgi:hypothetical protein